jgi:hypothetical protein
VLPGCPVALAGLHHWWELAPQSDGGSSTPGITSGTGAPSAPGGSSSSGAGGGLTAAAAVTAALGSQPGNSGSSIGGPSRSSSNIVPVPGTSLLFDKRSLRARKPSVRFRNTVHVMGLSGAVVPLHVSSYAVLVTDVPDPAEEDTSEDNELGSNWSVDDAQQRRRAGTTLCGPCVHGARWLLKGLDRGLQSIV